MPDNEENDEYDLVYYSSLVFSFKEIIIVERIIT